MNRLLVCDACGGRAKDMVVRFGDWQLNAPPRNTGLDDTLRLFCDHHAAPLGSSVFARLTEEFIEGSAWDVAELITASFREERGRSPKLQRAYDRMRERRAAAPAGANA